MIKISATTIQTPQGIWDIAIAGDCPFCGQELVFDQIHIAYSNARNRKWLTCVVIDGGLAGIILANKRESK